MTNEAMNQWITESWLIEHVNSDWTNWKMNFWPNDIITEWLNATSTLSYPFFTAPPLGWSTSSVRQVRPGYFLTVLLWAASYLGYFFSDLPPSATSELPHLQLHSLRTAAFMNLQLQPGIATWSTNSRLVALNFWGSGTVMRSEPAPVETQTLPWRPLEPLCVYIITMVRTLLSFPANAHAPGPLPWSTASTSQLLLPPWLTWTCENGQWTFVRNSEVC